MLSDLNYILHYGPHLCSRMSPDSKYSALYSALVCGLPWRGEFSGLSQLLIDSGLIHLFVVSGAHLFFLERRLRRVLPHKWILICLGLYAWLTGFGTPVLRAMLRRFVAILLKPWGWTRLQIEATTSLLMLGAFPLWIFSRSFLMSWLCALALNFPNWKLLSPNFNRNVSCYVFLLPFSAASPLSIAWNCLVAPWVGEILFPLSVLCFLLPPLTTVGDFAWQVLIWILEWGPQSPTLPFFLNSPWLILIPLILHLILLKAECVWRKNSAFLV